MSSDRPALARLDLELAGTLLVLLIAGALLARAHRHVDQLRLEFKVERNRRLEAQEHAEKRETDLDRALEALKEANDRNDDRAGARDRPAARRPAGGKPKPAAGTSET